MTRDTHFVCNPIYKLFKMVLKTSIISAHRVSRYPLLVRKEVGNISDKRRILVQVTIYGYCGKYRLSYVPLRIF